MKPKPGIIITKISASTTPVILDGKPKYSSTVAVDEVLSFLKTQKSRYLKISEVDDAKYFDAQSYLSLGIWDYLFLQYSNDLYSVSRYSSYISYLNGIRALNVLFCFDNATNHSRLFRPLEDLNAIDSCPLLCLVECKYHPLFGAAHINIAQGKYISDYLLEAIENNLELIEKDFESKTSFSNLFRNTYLYSLLPINWADIAFIIQSDDLFKISQIVKAIRCIALKDMRDINVSNRYTKKYIQTIDYENILQHHVFSATVSFINIKLNSDNTPYSLSSTNVENALPFYINKENDNKLYHPKLNVWLSVHPGHEDMVYEEFVAKYREYCNTIPNGYTDKDFTKDRFIFGEKDLLLTPKQYLEPATSQTLQVISLLNYFFNYLQTAQANAVYPYIYNISSDLELINNYKCDALSIGEHAANQYANNIHKILDNPKYKDNLKKFLAALDAANITSGNLNALNNFISNVIQLIKDPCASPFYLDYLELFICSAERALKTDKLNTRQYDDHMSVDLRFLSDSLQDYYINSIYEGEGSDLGRLFKGGYQSVLLGMRSYSKYIFRYLDLDVSINIALTPSISISIDTESSINIAHIMTEATMNLNYFDLATIIHEAAHWIRKTNRGTVFDKYRKMHNCIEQDAWRPELSEIEDIYCDLCMIKVIFNGLKHLAHEETSKKLNNISLYEAIVLSKIAEKSIKDPDNKDFLVSVLAVFRDIIQRYYFMNIAIQILLGEKSDIDIISFKKSAIQFARNIYVYYFIGTEDMENIETILEDTYYELGNIPKQLFELATEESIVDEMEILLNGVELNDRLDGKELFSNVLSIYSRYVDTIIAEFRDGIHWVERNKEYGTNLLQQIEIAPFKYGYDSGDNITLYFYSSNIGANHKIPEIFLSRNALFFFKTHAIRNAVSSIRRDLHLSLTSLSYYEYWRTFDSLSPA